MNRVHQLTGPQGQRLVVVAGITGLSSDADLVREAFPSQSVASVLLGIPFEDLDAIRATAGKEREAEFEANELDQDYFQRLSEFEPAETPPPDLYVAYELATAAQAPVAAVDLGDEAYTEEYTKNVGMFEVLRTNRRQKRLSAAAIPATSALEFVLAWDREVYEGKGARRVQAAREEFMAQRLAATTPGPGVHFALLPFPRTAPVVNRLLEARWHSTSDGSKS